MTLVVYFQMSGYRTFKHFYLKHVSVYWRQLFPGLPSYNRFVELMAEVLNPLAAFMQSRCGKSKGIAFVDSPRCVFVKTSEFPATKPSQNKQDAANHQQVGFTVSNYISSSMTVATFCHSA
jgi:hypothetical protein